VFLILLSLIPALWVVVQEGATWWSLVVGAAAWACGVGLKVLVAALLPSAVSTDIRVRFTATVQGVASACVELGVAALAYLWIATYSLPTWSDVLGLAIGAGSAETLAVAAMACVDNPAPDVVARWQLAAKRSLCVRHVREIERTLSMLGHIGSRGLVGMALLSSSVWPFVIAVLTFTATDGLAALGHLRNWDWFNSRTCVQFHGICGGLVVLELALLIWLIARV
jgi:hypothetical protein